MIKLMQGDCLELMKEIPDKSVDMVLTDPPYGIDFQSVWKKDKSKRMPKIMNDKKPFTDFIPFLERVLKPTGCVMIFTRWDVQQSFIDAMTESSIPPNSCLVWDKKIHGMGDLRRAFGSRHEDILFHAEHDFRFQGKRPVDVVECQRVSPSKLMHPNEKPVLLLEDLICKCCPVGGGVLDLFMGSGSTGVACINTNRNFIGMELDEHYFRIAEERIGKAIHEQS